MTKSQYINIHSGCQIVVLHKHNQILLCTHLYYLPSFTLLGIVLDFLQEQTLRIASVSPCKTKGDKETRPETSFLAFLTSMNVPGKLREIV